MRILQEGNASNFAAANCCPHLHVAIVCIGHAAGVGAVLIAASTCALLAPLVVLLPELLLAGGVPELLVVGLLFVAKELGALIFGCSWRMPALYTTSVPSIKMLMTNFFIGTTIRRNPVYLLTICGQEAA